VYSASSFQAQAWKEVVKQLSAALIGGGLLFVVARLDYHKWRRWAWLLVGITSVLLVLLLSQARVLLAMARDGLIPREFFGAVHPRFRTPHKGTILTGVLVAIVAALFPLRILAELVNIGTLMAFVIVCAAVWVMRRTNPQLPRPFRTPLVPYVPLAGMGMNFWLMYSLGWENWVRLVVWLVIGLGIYFFYGRKRSTMALQRAAASTSR